LRKWRRLTFTGIAFVFGAVLLGPVVNAWMLPFFLAGGVLGTIAQFGAVWFTCPRCRQAFGTRDWFWSAHPALFRSRCVHCGIAMGTSKALSDVQEATRLSPAAKPPEREVRPLLGDRTIQGPS
jgi:hypothetical protein